MPRSTALYPFEFKVLEWACSFSRWLTGENRGFLLIVDDRCGVRRLHSEKAENEFDLALKDKLIVGNPRWLFYHPFDAPEYTFIEWQGVEVAVWERLIGKPFEARDFVSERDGKSIEGVPISWKVMF